jgi:hypothetical protein
MREFFFVGKKNQHDSVAGGLSGVFVIDTIRRLHQLSPRCSTSKSECGSISKSLLPDSGWIAASVFSSAEAPNDLRRAIQNWGGPSHAEKT